MIYDFRHWLIYSSSVAKVLDHTTEKHKEINEQEEVDEVFCDPEEADIDEGGEEEDSDFAEEEGDELA